MTGFVDVYITPDGLDADSLPDVGSGGQVPSNGRMFVTLEGLGINNSFVLNTTLADARIPRGHSHSKGSTCAKVAIAEYQLVPGGSWQ